MSTLPLATSMLAGGESATTVHVRRSTGTERVVVVGAVFSWIVVVVASDLLPLRALRLLADETDNF